MCYTGLCITRVQLPNKEVNTSESPFVQPGHDAQIHVEYLVAGRRLRRLGPGPRRRQQRRCTCTATRPSGATAPLRSAYGAPEANRPSGAKDALSSPSTPRLARARVPRQRQPRTVARPPRQARCEHDARPSGLPANRRASSRY